MKSAKSIALQFDQDLPAPFVVAKGKGNLAVKLVELAQQCGIPIASSESLAENLFYLEVGEFIPEPFYRVVAELLAFVWRTDLSLGSRDVPPQQINQERNVDGS